MGVEVGTETLWKYTEQFHTPVIFVANKVDSDQSNFDKTVQQAKDRFGRQVTVVQYPLNEGNAFNAIIDVLKMTMYKFPAEGGKPEKLPIPESEREKANALHRELIEIVAENDEELMSQYFEKGELDEDEIRIGLRKAMVERLICPLFVTSAKKDMGSGRIMGFIDNVVPAPVEMPPKKTVDGKDLVCDPQGKPSLFVFKSMSEPHLGEMSFFRVYSGTIHHGHDLVNEQTDVTERLGQIFAVNGKRREDVAHLYAGDIGATVKLKNTHVNNTLHEKGEHLVLPSIEFPAPKVRIAVHTTKKG
jgi:elongation factor G